MPSAGSVGSLYGSRCPLPRAVGRTMAEHSSDVTANDLFWAPSVYDGLHDWKNQKDMPAKHDVQDKTATQELNKTSKQAKGNEVHGNK